jgi:type I restriction enzyme S subunit
VISTRIKNVARINRETLSETTDPDFRFHYIDIGAVDALGRVVVPDEKVSFSNAPSRARRLAPTGAVIISTVRTYLRAVASVPETSEPLVFSTGFAVLEAEPQVDSRFLAYLCRSESFITEVSARSVGVSYPAINALDIGNIPIMLPERDEQRRIADFLDAETARIDTLMSTKERAFELIDERRSALTSELCLRGLNRETTRRESGIDSVGAVPTHWAIMRNKFFQKEVTELSSDGSEELLTVSHLTGVTPRSDKSVNMFMAESLAGYKICQPGDLVINTLWAWMGALGVSSHHGIVSPAYGVYRFTTDEAIPEYFHLLYRTPEYVCEMTRHSKGVWTSRLRLYPESFLSLRSPFPPRREQEEIVKTLERMLEPEVQLQDSIRRSNILLAERRQALITAAVTGQIDVSTASGRGIED